MSPVKNQGTCGSCWAFSATTAAEATLAIKNNSAPYRLSEQQLVDCTNTTTANKNMFGKTYGTYGCGGGWMAYAWNFMRDHGAMEYGKYPYTGKDETCKHNSSQTVGKIASYGRITTSIEDAKAKLREQPMTIAVDASSAAFQLYKSGVLDDTDNCGTSLNHAVVLVGFSEAGDDVDPTPEPTPEPTPDPVPVPLECVVTKWWRNCPDSGARRLADAQGDTDYWKIQNSWGTSWGDQGFIKIAITSGSGVCAMNSYIEYVDWTSNMYA